MSEELPMVNTPTPQEPKLPKSKIKWGIFAVAVLVLALGAGAYFVTSTQLFKGLISQPSAYCSEPGIDGEYIVCNSVNGVDDRVITEGETFEFTSVNSYPFNIVKPKPETEIVIDAGGLTENIKPADTSIVINENKIQIDPLEAWVVDGSIVDGVFVDMGGDMTEEMKFEIENGAFTQAEFGALVEAAYEGGYSPDDFVQILQQVNGQVGVEGVMAGMKQGLAVDDFAQMNQMDQQGGQNFENDFNLFGASIASTPVTLKQYGSMQVRCGEASDGNLVIPGTKNEACDWEWYGVPANTEVEFTPNSAEGKFEIKYIAAEGQAYTETFTFKEAASPPAKIKISLEFWPDNPNLIYEDSLAGDNKTRLKVSMEDGAVAPVLLVIPLKYAGFGSDKAKNNDYNTVPNGGNAVFLSGNNFTWVDINAVNDTSVEDNEMLQVTLGNMPLSYTKDSSKKQVEITIISDDVENTTCHTFEDYSIALDDLAKTGSKTEINKLAKEDKAQEGKCTKFKEKPPHKLKPNKKGKIVEDKDQVTDWHLPSLLFSPSSPSTTGKFNEKTGEYTTYAEEGTEYILVETNGGKSSAQGWFASVIAAATGGEEMSPSQESITLHTIEVACLASETFDPKTETCVLNVNPVPCPTFDDYAKLLKDPSAAEFEKNLELLKGMSANCEFEFEGIDFETNETKVIIGTAENVLDSEPTNPLFNESSYTAGSTPGTEYLIVELGPTLQTPTKEAMLRLYEMTVTEPAQPGDIEVSLDINKTAIYEGGTGSMDEAEITASLEAGEVAPAGGVTIPIVFGGVGDNAESGDYSRDPSTNSIVIAAGDNEAYKTIEAESDSDTDHETLKVELGTLPTGYTQNASKYKVSITIIDDDSDIDDDDDNDDDDCPEGYYLNSNGNCVLDRGIDVDQQTGLVSVDDILDLDEFSCLKEVRPVEFEDTSKHAVIVLASLAQENKPVTIGYSEVDGRYYLKSKRITREEVIKMLVISSCEDFGYAPNVFKDVNISDPKDWAAPFINTAYKNGLVVGYSNGTFKPDSNVTRMEAIKILYKIADLTAPNASGSNPFDDLEDDHWGYDLALDAYELGIIGGQHRGSKLYLYPDEEITRYDMAIIIHNFYAVKVEEGN